MSVFSLSKVHADVIKQLTTEKGAADDDKGLGFESLRDFKNCYSKENFEESLNKLVAAIHSLKDSPRLPREQSRAKAAWDLAREALEELGEITRSARGNKSDELEDWEDSLPKDEKEDG